MKGSRFTTIDGYLTSVKSEAQRAALAKLRKQIRSAAPKAEECISYQIPSFRLGGKYLVGFAATAKHCAFYPGAFPIAAHRSELRSYDTSKGTIRYPASTPLPDSLVRKLVRSRVSEISGNASARSARE